MIKGKDLDNNMENNEFPDPAMHEHVLLTIHCTLKLFVGTNEHNYL